MDKRLDVLAEALVIVGFLTGEAFYLERLKKLLYFLMAVESYDYNQKTKGK
jgi:hypothetical protein